MKAWTVIRVRSMHFLVMAALLSAPGRRAVAEAVHYDVLVTSLSGTLVVGGFADASNTAIAPLRVFGGEALGIGSLDPYASDEEPGIRAVDQTFLSGAAMNPSGVYQALPGNRALTFTFQPIAIGAVTRNLFFWNGEGTVNFTPLTAFDSLALVRGGFPTWTRTITGTSAGVVTGATIDSTDGNGVIHKHLTTVIASGGAAPATGFYLFALAFQMSGLAPSADSYFVYGAYDVENAPDLLAFEAAHDAALDWVEANLVAVPEPTTGLLATAAAVGPLFIRVLRRRGTAVAAPRSRV